MSGISSTGCPSSPMLAYMATRQTSMVSVVVKLAMRLFFSHPPMAMRLLAAMFSPMIGV